MKVQGHLPVFDLAEKDQKPVSLTTQTMGHKNNRTPGAFGKRHEWQPYRYFGNLPKNPVVVIGDLAGAFATLHRVEHQQRIQQRNQELSFKLGRKVEELSNLRKETDNLVKELEKTEGGSGVIRSDAGRAILARIIRNNKTADDLKAVITELKQKLNQ